MVGESDDDRSGSENIDSTGDHDDDDDDLLAGFGDGAKNGDNGDNMEKKE